MKRIAKFLTVTLLAIVAACACVLTITACGGEKKADYNFTIVYEDGKAVNGEEDGSNGKVSTQLCGPDGACHPVDLGLNLYPDKNGKLNLTQAQVNQLFESETDVTVFVFHVMYVKDHKGDCEVSVNGKGDYKVTVTK